MRVYSEQINKRIESIKKNSQRKISKNHAKICCDLLTIFGYKLLVIFKTGFIKHREYKKSYFAVAVDKFGKKCFLLLYSLGNNRWFFKDLNLIRAYRSTLITLDIYSNTFLRHYKQSCYFILPSLFINTEKEVKEELNLEIPEQLKIFRSAKQN